MRVYDEINDFEKLLIDDYYIIGKFFYYISKEEQLKRFKDREKNFLKRWKIIDEDWCNCEKWDEYVEVMEDMFEKISKLNVKWYIIESNDKLYVCVKMLKIIILFIEDYFLEYGIELFFYYYEMKEDIEVL